MSGFDIATIIDKKDKTLPKPYINRPGFDMKYVDHIYHIMVKLMLINSIKFSIMRDYLTLYLL